MVETADVVVTNFKPGTMNDWGVGYTDAAQRNPRIVYAMGSSFGTEGPDTAREGADLSAQAAGGLISTTGGHSSDPSPVGATVADHICPGQNLLAGVLAALFARERGRAGGSWWRPRCWRESGPRQGNTPGISCPGSPRGRAAQPPDDSRDLRALSHVRRVDRLVGTAGPALTSSTGRSGGRT